MLVLCSGEGMEYAVGRRMVVVDCTCSSDYSL